MIGTLLKIYSKFENHFTHHTNLIYALDYQTLSQTRKDKRTH
jgi:hypothetical protein